MTEPAIRRVVLVHGYGAQVHDHWFDWLTRVAPGVERTPMPAPHAPRAQAWVDAARAAIGALDEHTAVVGHSLGCITAARAVQDLAGTGTLGALALVAPFARRLPPTGEADLDTFSVTHLDAFVDGYDPAVVRSAVRRRAVLRSDDDPTVPAAASDDVAAGLGVRAVVVPGAGHFLETDGVTTLPPLLDALGLDGAC